MTGRRWAAPSGSPPEAQASITSAERLVDLVVLQVEDVLRLREHALARQQLAERPYLLEEPGGEPVLAVELVVLHVREDEPAHPEHLVERGRGPPRWPAGPRYSAAIRSRSAISLLGGPAPACRRPSPGGHSAVRAANGTVRFSFQLQVVMVEAVAGGHVEPRVARGVEGG